MWNYLEIDNLTEFYVDALRYAVPYLCCASGAPCYLYYCMSELCVREVTVEIFALVTKASIAFLSVIMNQS